MAAQEPVTLFTLTTSTQPFWPMQSVAMELHRRPIACGAREQSCHGEVATMNFRKATGCSVWAAAAIVLAITLIGTAGPAYAAGERRETLSGVDVAFHDNDPDTKWEYQLSFARFR